MPSESTTIKVTVEVHGKLKDYAAREGLSLSEAVEHLLALGDGKGVKVEARSPKAREAVKRAATKSGGPKVDDIRTMRERAWEDLKDVAASTWGKDFVAGLDYCVLCGARPGEYHNARCLPSKAGKVIYEGRPEGENEERR